MQRFRKEVDYPRKIASNWKGVPRHASAAFSWNEGEASVSGVEYLSQTLELKDINVKVLKNLDSPKESFITNPY